MASSAANNFKPEEINQTSKTMAEATNAAIRWPEEYLPGTSDNFTSNETIIKDLSVSQIWAKLADCTQWELIMATTSSKSRHPRPATS